MCKSHKEQKASVLIEKEVARGSLSIGKRIGGERFMSARDRVKVLAILKESEPRN